MSWPPFPLSSEGTAWEMGVLGVAWPSRGTPNTDQPWRVLTFFPPWLPCSFRFPWVRRTRFTDSSLVAKRRWIKEGVMAFLVPIAWQRPGQESSKRRTFSVGSTSVIQDEGNCPSNPEVRWEPEMPSNGQRIDQGSPKFSTMNHIKYLAQCQRPDKIF